MTQLLAPKYPKISKCFLKSREMTLRIRTDNFNRSQKNRTNTSNLKASKQTKTVKLTGDLPQVTMTRQATSKTPKARIMNVGLASQSLSPKNKFLNLVSRKENNNATGIDPRKHQPLLYVSFTKCNRCIVSLPVFNTCTNTVEEPMRSMGGASFTYAMSLNISTYNSAVPCLLLYFTVKRRTLMCWTVLKNNHRHLQQHKLVTLTFKGASTDFNINIEAISSIDSNCALTCCAQ